MHSPTRKVTVKEQKEWKIPPCISNWKNAKVSRNFSSILYLNRVYFATLREVTLKRNLIYSILPRIWQSYVSFQGYTIPLDKRLAADGRGLQQVHINENFAKLAEALYIADRKARQAVEMRAQLEKKLAQKEKEKKEDHLRQLAQKAREERAGLKSAATLGLYNCQFIRIINSDEKNTPES